MTQTRRARSGLLLACLLGAMGVLFVTAQAHQRSGGQADKGVQNTPKQVLILRHAEKPIDENDIHLTSRGAARAAALPALFMTSSTFPTKPAPFATPEFLFAAKPTKRSNRSVETVTPLAKALADMPISQKQANDDFPEVVEKLFSQEKYVGKTVLICWHHGNIPEMTLAIAAKARNRDTFRDQIPKRWDGAVFDRVWRVEFDEVGNATFANLPQKLMFGDSKK